MSQIPPVSNFDWVEDTSQFNEVLLKKHLTKKVMKDLFLKLMFNILEIYITFTMIFYFYRKE